MRYDDANSWHYMQVAGIAAYQSFQKLTEALNNIQANYGKKYLITFA